MMKKLFFSLFFFTLIIQIIEAQVETKYFPKKDAHKQIRHVQNVSEAKIKKEIPSFDVQKLIDDEAQNNGVGSPYRFGKGFDVNVTLKDEGWTKVDEGRLWSMEFISKGAYSINFVFEEFYLPEGAELYVINSKGDMLYGPVTSEQNTKEGNFLTDLIQGDDVIIYLFEPKSKKGESTLTIKRVVHAYKNLLYGDLGASGSCNNDITCFPDWDEESDAVALVLLSNGVELCSGSLVMTADQSFRPYFLSAFHCIDTNGNGDISLTEESNAENWLFKFQYKKTSCGGSTATWGITYNGAQFRAAWNTSDFALMEMDDSPLGDNRFSWLGWDRSGNTPTSGSGIHHPSGDVMKISFDDDPISETSNGSTSGGTSHWFVEIDDGTLEQGSSGSPLFNEDRRVVGQLHSGFPGCSSSKRFWYGCFHRSWTGGGADNNRLSNWLDPCGTGAVTTNTSRSPLIAGSTVVCSSGTSISVNNLPAGSTITWNQSSNISRSSSQGANPCTFTASGSGEGWIEATIATGCGNFTLPRRTVWVGTPSIDYIQGPTSVQTNTYYTYYAQPSNMNSGTTYYWYVYPSGNFYTSSTNQKDISFSSPGQYELVVSAENACGSGFDEPNIQINVSGYSYLTISPNPSASETTLTINSASGETANSETQWDLEIYDQNQTLTLKKSKLNGSVYNLNTASWKRGVYIVRVNYKNELLTGKLIVTK